MWSSIKGIVLFKKYEYLILNTHINDSHDFLNYLECKQMYILYKKLAALFLNISK
jgi:hypothetical protein